jgi:hypothetical protein
VLLEVLGEPKEPFAGHANVYFELLLHDLLWLGCLNNRLLFRYRQLELNCTLVSDGLIKG